jgi:hypothetical protein
MAEIGIGRMALLRHSWRVRVSDQEQVRLMGRHFRCHDAGRHGQRAGVNSIMKGEISRPRSVLGVMS